MNILPPYRLPLAFLTLLAACAPQSPTPASSAVSAERGKYLVTIGACHDCHTPKVMTPAGPVLDTSRLLSGHPANDTVTQALAGMAGTKWEAATNGHLTAWTGPWGISYTANLTPDRTGLAGWTAEVFIETIRKGRHARVGRPLLPPMPWPMYAHMTDDDLRSVFAYLQTIRPVSNLVPPPVAPAGANTATVPAAAGRKEG
jgi:mono/diheme cytochrome c family protein